MRLIWRLSDWFRHKARLRRGDPRHAWGARGEDLAHRFLQKLGYIVVARNWRAEDGSGELDLVAWDGSTLVVVEVKTRASIEFGLPEEAVDHEKRYRLSRTAARYTRESDVPASRVRFDIVSVVLGAKPEIGHIRDAFTCQL
ncbi:MAG TPA: YraN family protein [Bryobacteraceae bacterium]|nr:YraN family protein [Bryobacteraceae bacterium]